ncbi:hypothetical protein [Asaia bogorensis]|uniref:hypothetical protein n=1 Tax=Asaia bogorensis TaxID=91915 RepID=UPI000EFC5DA1|nr:hypothetical protein [Asaia bogorensis]
MAQNTGLALLGRVVITSLIKMAADLPVERSGHMGFALSVPGSQVERRSFLTTNAIHDKARYDPSIVDASS